MIDRWEMMRINGGNLLEYDIRDTRYSLIIEDFLKTAGISLFGQDIASLSHI